MSGSKIPQPAPPGPATPRPTLVFSWQSLPATSWRLSFFLIVAAAAHLAFFYLFRVVYPQPARSIPSPQTITVLSHANPLARPILAQTADRVSSLVAGDSRSASLADHSTTFVPSFRDFEFSLRVPPQQPNPVDLPPVALPGVPVLPPLAVVSPNAAVPQNPALARPTLAFSGNLAGRQILRSPTWDPDSLARLQERRFRFSAGFDPLGRPIFILPIDSPGNPDSPATTATLATALKSLRLNPASTPASGTIEIAW